MVLKKGFWKDLFNISNKGNQCHIQMCFATNWMVWTPENIFSCVFSLKTKWNKPRTFQKHKSFRDTQKFFSQGYQILNIFGLRVTDMRGLWVSLNHPHTIFKEKVCEKKHLHGIFPQEDWRDIFIGHWGILKFLPAPGGLTLRGI